MAQDRGNLLGALLIDLVQEESERKNDDRGVSEADQPIVITEKIGRTFCDRAFSAHFVWNYRKAGSKLFIMQIILYPKIQWLSRDFFAAFSACATGIQARIDSALPSPGVLRRRPRKVFPGSIQTTPDAVPLVQHDGNQICDACANHSKADEPRK